MPSTAVAASTGRENARKKARAREAAHKAEGDRIENDLEEAMSSLRSDKPKDGGTKARAPPFFAAYAPDGTA